MGADALLLKKIRDDGQAIKTLPKERTFEIDQRSVSLLRPLLQRCKDRSRLLAFQRYGVAWLLRSKRAILCDEMGLGKTVQAIVALQKLMEFGRARKALILCPKILINNWLAEFRYWAPNLIVDTISAASSASQRSPRKAHVLVISYDYFRENSETYNNFDVHICDEAHRLRNRSSQLSKVFARTTAGRIWFLTGTPIEKSREDLLTLLSLLSPNRFSPADLSIHPNSLRSRARPYMLRRTKAEVLTELPVSEERLIELDLNSAQDDLYRETALSAKIVSPLVRLNKLRKICDLDHHCPTMSPKLLGCLKIIESCAKTSEKCVVFSHTLAPIHVLADVLRGCGLGHLSLQGQMTSEQRELALKKFSEETSYHALLASTKLASEGLTLTAANHIIFINKWWNPSSNAQARDRIVRLGQKKTCFVYSFLIRGTIEERLENLLEAKQHISDEILLDISESERALFSTARSLVTN